MSARSAAEISGAYGNIAIAGGDTSAPLSLRKRLNRIRPHVADGSGRFLDCGCGRGEYVFQLAERFHLDAYGIEYSQDKVRRARLHPIHGHRIAQGDIQALPFGPGEFDYAMVNEVLEHVPDDTLALKEVHRVLKPGGLLFIFSPNRWFPFETHAVHLKRSDRILPHWVPFVPYIPLPIGRHLFRYGARNYGQRKLRQLAVGAGFAVIETGFVWQTFEGISGQQPRLVRWLKPVLRRVSDRLEATPLVSRFGLSQALVCRAL